MEPTRNLLIVQSPPEQDPADWIAVKQIIERKAPDIEVRIATNRQRNSVTSRWQVKRPSLVFSPVRLIDYEPRGGAIYCGHVLGKAEELRRLAAIGIPVPKTELLSPVSTLDPADWGEYVVVKANSINSGEGVRLVRTADLPARYAELWAAVGGDQLLVEPYIDHSPDGHPSLYRLLVLFGRTLYSVYTLWAEKRRPLAEIASDPRGIIASNSHAMEGDLVKACCNDPEIISLAERAHRAFPECPVLGVDIIRDTRSGQLYMLEVNAHGAVWHLSSPLAKSMGADHLRERYAQFNALERTADVLIEKTRADAC